MLRFLVGAVLLLFVAPLALPLLTVFLVFLPLLLVGLVLKLVFGIVLFPLKLFLCW